LFVPVSFNIGKMQKLPNGRNAVSGDINIYIYDGKKHRVGGPAEINKRTGYEAWFKHGMRHRDDGPALINPEGKYIEYWKNGKFLRRDIL
jgi:hypothetical protein